MNSSDYDDDGLVPESDIQEAIDNYIEDYLKIGELLNDEDVGPKIRQYVRNKVLPTCRKKWNIKISDRLNQFKEWIEHGVYVSVDGVPMHYCFTEEEEGMQVCFTPDMENPSEHEICMSTRNIRSIQQGQDAQGSYINIDCIGDVLTIRRLVHMEAPSPKQERTCWEGIHVVLTGFRSPKLEKDLREIEVKVDASVTKNTTFLIMKNLGEGGSKDKTALLLGAKVVSKDHFEGNILPLMQQAYRLLYG